MAKSCITVCFTYFLRMAIFLNTYISQGSVATRLVCGGVFVYDFFLQISYWVRFQPTRRVWKGTLEKNKGIWNLLKFLNLTLTLVVWINSPAVSLSATSVSAVAHTPEYAFLLLLFEYILCTPASSAPVERVFSQSGLLLRPHRARMSDKLLESLVLLQCSWHEWLLLTDYFNMNWLVILYVYHFHVNLNMKLTVCKGYRIQCCKK